MIRKAIFLISATLLFSGIFFFSALGKEIKDDSGSLNYLSEKETDSLVCEVQPFYKYRPDGKPGREVKLYFRGRSFSGKGVITLDYGSQKETIPFDWGKGTDKTSVMLYPEVGVHSDCVVNISVSNDRKVLSNSCFVKARRYWTVYIYPHSHVDIGYTNTQKNVELIHKRNLINGIKLAEATRNYPEGSRYLWNPEVIWPVERYLKNASPEQRQIILDAIEKGYLRLDAGYIHTNTSSSADEELFGFFKYARDLEKLTGTKVETLVQVDIPGMSWGVVPVAASLGIRYCFALNNGSDRVGLSTKHSFRPFWWVGPDGNSKILFLQPGDYTPGARAKGFAYWPSMAGQTDTSKLISIVKTDHPREKFIDKYLFEKLEQLENADFYPYDIFAMTWAMADNTPIDADLPDAVRSWNEEYAYPRLVISSATDIMRAFESRYGDQFPVLRGDFTEYWTDGLGTAAKQTSMNRTSKERLIEAETLWSMVRKGEDSPCNDFDEAWRNIILGTEHTWCFMDPSRQPITNDILKVKFGYFEEGRNRSIALLDTATSKISDIKSNVIGVFNTLSWARNGIVTIAADQSENFNAVKDEDGATVLCQRLTTGELAFWAAEVPSLGMKRYYLIEGKNETAATMAKGNILDNGLLKVTVDPNSGDVVSLISGDHEFVNRETGSINNFSYVKGTGNTTSGPQYASKRTDNKADSPVNNVINASAPANVKLQVKEQGPLVSSLLVKSDAEGCNSLTREIRIIAGQKYLEIENTVDKKPVLEKEGIHFGFSFNISDPVTRIDIPWGVVELEKDQLAGANRNWIAFQRWLDISNNSQGITWCSLDAPVFEHGAITANIIGAASDSPQWIKRLTPSATIYSWALNNHWHTNFPLSQEGSVLFRYRILCHNSPYEPALSNRFGMEQSQPLIAVPVKTDTKVDLRFKICGDPSIVLSSLKTEGDGSVLILRLRSVSSREETVIIEWQGDQPGELRMIDCNGGSDMKVKGDGFTIPAYGVVTIKASF